MMKSKHSPSARQARPWGRWTAYAVAAVLFGVGQILLRENRMAPAAGLSAAGILLALGVYVLPSLPIRETWLALGRLLRRQPRLPGGRAGRGAAAPAPGWRARIAGLGGLGRGLGQVLDARLRAWFPDDCLRMSRYWLLLPAVVSLGFSLGAMTGGGTTRAVLFFAVAALLGAVYLQDMERPLMLPNLGRNLAALGSFSLALPLQAWGAYLLHTRFSNVRMVWLGSLVCALASAWMIRSLKVRPFDLEEAGAPHPRLEHDPGEPFFNPARLAWISSLLTGAALSAYLAKVVFPAEHPGWSVGMGFLSMALLIGSFPWIPRGLAWLRALPPAATAALALATALAAFVLGRHGQLLIERHNVNGGLWWFLAGGVLLVAGLSRFQAPQAALGEARQDSPWPRLEIAAFVLLVAVGFSFRFWNVGNFPYGVEGDEGGGGVWAMDTLLGKVEHPLIHQNYPLAFFSVTALFFKVAGVSIESLRWHSVIFGTLSIATTYLFLRLLMGRWTAFLATLLMSFSYWHLHYSRFGHYNIEQVALQMAAFYFVFKAMRTAKLWQWVTGGLAFGLAMFPHMAGRLLPFQGIALVIYLFAARRDLLRRHLPGFLAFVMGAWAIAAPAVVYWDRARGISMGRIQSVSIFDKNNSNAPVDTLAGFVRNCKVSMLMFNDFSDSRHRNNPVASEKILEHWTAVLFGLAFLYALWHWRDPLVFFLLSAFFMNLAASIFSVEAPQTLRTAGNIPLVFVFIALPIAHLRSAWLRLGRWPANLLFTLLLLPAVAFFSWRSGQKLFVQARNLSFDTYPTFIALKAGTEGGPDTQAVFWGTGFASSHPPMVLLAQQTPIRNFYGLFEYLPITRAVDRDHLLFLSDEYQQALPYLRWLYPQAPVEAIPDHIQGNNLAQYLRVNKDQIHALLGLAGQARVNGRVQAVTGAAPRWPQPGLENARQLELRGSVMLDSYARYGFEVTGRGPAELKVGGKTLFRRGAGGVERREAVLAKGLHSFELKLDPAQSNDAMAVQVSAVQPGGLAAFYVQRGRNAYELQQSQVLRAPVSGFYARYYATRVPGAEAACEIIEPVVLNQWLDSPLVGNWSVRWRTRFKVDQPGHYGFSLRGGASYATVHVDGRLVFRQGMHPEGEAVAPRVEPGLALQPGWHDYEAVFSTTGPPGCQLRWTPAGQADQLFWTPDMRPWP